MIIKKITSLVIISVLIINIGLVIRLFLKYQKEHGNIKLEKQVKIVNIRQSYNQYVRTTQEKSIYKLQENEYVEIGKIGNQISLELEEIDVNTYENSYFKIKDKEFYVEYTNLEKIDSKVANNQRHKLFIPFNENIVTKNNTVFYSSEDLTGVVATIYKEFNLPILVKGNNCYGVEIGDRLAFVKKEDVSEIKQVENTTESSAKDVPVLLYHFFFNVGEHPEYENMTTVISMRSDKFENQLKYLQDNNYMTLKMAELEWFIDGKINIPEKSVVLTIDDGHESIYSIAYPIIEKYKANFTVFNICSYFPNAINNQNEYVEIHSHGFDLHQYGVAGGIIKTINYEAGVEDLKKASEMLNNSKYFAYPFGDYNNHAVEMLKQAGYKMAFTTEWNNAKTGVDKYLVPRYYIYNECTIQQFANRIR